MKRIIERMSQALAVSLLGVMVTGVSLAYAAGIASASLARAHRVSVNGKSAVAGTTLFNQARLRTEKDGVALAQIGPAGSVHLGAESEMSLRLASDSIGGELTAGHVAVSARSGFPILVTAAGATITTDGKQPGSLVVMVQGKETRLVSLLSDAQVSLDGQTEVVKKCQVIRFTAQEPRRRIVPLGLVAAGSGIGIAATLATVSNRSTAVLRTITPGINPSPILP